MIVNISIESATRERVEGYWHALDVVARERCYLLFTEAPPLESTQHFVNGLIEKNETQFYALDEERVVGWCDVLRNERCGTTHSGCLGIGVLPEYRGAGLGRRLIAVAIEDAFAKGIERIELEVFASNERAIALYHAVGFIEEGRKLRARFLDGSYDDFVMMALLKEPAMP